MMQQCDSRNVDPARCGQCPHFGTCLTLNLYSKFIGLDTDRLQTGASQEETVKTDLLVEGVGALLTAVPELEGKFKPTEEVVLKLSERLESVERTMCDVTMLAQAILDLLKRKEGVPSLHSLSDAPLAEDLPDSHEISQRLQEPLPEIPSWTGQRTFLGANHRPSLKED